MHKIVRKAALELKVLDSSQTVKVAGVLRRLKNVFKQITDKQFASEVDKIRGESIELQGVSAQLNHKIDELLSSIKDGDVASYENALAQVRELSDELAKELKQLNQAAKSGRKELSKNTDSEQSELTPPPAQIDPRRYDAKEYENREQWTKELKEQNPEDDVPISERLPKNSYFDKFNWYKGANFTFTPGSKRTIIEKIAKAVVGNVPPEEIQAAVQILDANWDELFERMTNAIRTGAVIWRGTKRPTKVRRLKGETYVLVNGSPITLPGLEVQMNATYSISDDGLTGRDRALKLTNITAWTPGNKRTKAKPVEQTPPAPPPSTPTPTTANRLDALKRFALTTQQRPHQVIKVDDLQLAKALIGGYRMVYGSDPSMETLGAAWAQAMFERPTGALPNYNIGNIRATKEWISSGKPYFIWGTTELDRTGRAQKDDVAKWRAYETPEEGAAGYWKLLGGRYKDAIKWMEAGDPVSAAVIMGKKGYYTANIEKYAPAVGSIYKRFMTNIAPQLPMIKSSPQPPPSDEKPAVVDTRFSAPSERSEKSTPAVSFHPSDEGSEADRLLGTLLAMGPVERLVTRSILETKLPKTDVVISLANMSAPFGMRLRFARAAANTLREIIDADVSIHSNGNKIELQCSALGSTYAVASAVHALCDCVNDALIEKTQKYSISYSVIPAAISKYAELKVLV